MIILKKIGTKWLSDLIDEDLLGTINGINTSFLSSKVFNPNSVLIFLNGLKLFEGSDRDYTKGLDNKTINFIYPPDVEDTLNIVYKTQTCGSDLCVREIMFYLSDGTRNDIPTVDGELPFYLENTTQNNIPMV